MAGKDYFDNTTLLLTAGTTARAGQINAILQALETSLALLPNADDDAPTTKGFGEVFEIVAPTADAHPARHGDILKRTTTYAADTGAANAYVVTLSPVPSAYAAGMELVFKATSANTGASTVNVNSLGAKAIKHSDGTALDAGDIAAGAMVRIIYDGTNFQLAADMSAASGANALLAAGYAADAENAASAAETAQGLAETAQAGAELAETNAAASAASVPTFSLDGTVLTITSPA